MHLYTPLFEEPSFHSYAHCSASSNFSPPTIVTDAASLAKPRLLYKRSHAHALSNPHLLLRAHVFFSARVSRFDVAVAFTFAFHSATVKIYLVDFHSFRCLIPSRSREYETNDNSFRSLFPRVWDFRSKRFFLPYLILSYDIREYRTEYRSLSSLLFFSLPDEKQSLEPSLTEISKNLTNSARSIRKISHFSNIGYAYLCVLGAS